MLQTSISLYIVHLHYTFSTNPKFYTFHIDHHMLWPWKVYETAWVHLFEFFALKQRSKLTFSKSRLLATVNCKMVAINKNSVAKKKGRALHDILHIAKKTWREDTSWPITWVVNVPNGTFSTLYFATVNLPIYVEFLNDERRKEKDRWCRRLSYWLNLSYYW